LDTDWLLLQVQRCWQHDFMERTAAMRGDVGGDCTSKLKMYFLPFYFRSFNMHQFNFIITLSRLFSQQLCKIWTDQKFSAGIACSIAFSYPIHSHSRGAARDCDGQLSTITIVSPKILAAPNPRSLATCMRQPTPLCIDSIWLVVSGVVIGGRRGGRPERHYYGATHYYYHYYYYHHHHHHWELSKNICKRSNVK